MASTSNFGLSTTTKFKVYDKVHLISKKSSDITTTKTKETNVTKPLLSESPSVDLEALLLSTLAANNEISDSWEFSIEAGIDHQNLVGTVKSLLVDAYVIDEPLTTTFWTLTEEGSEIALKGSPEFQVFNAVPEGGILMTELQNAVGVEAAKIGLGPCMKQKWLKKDGDKIFKIATSINDETATILKQILSGSNDKSVPEEELKNLKKRKLVQQITRKSIINTHKI